MRQTHRAYPISHKLKNNYLPLRPIQNTKNCIKMTTLTVKPNVNRNPHSTIISCSLGKRKVDSPHATITNNNPHRQALSDNSRLNRLYTLPDQPGRKQKEQQHLINQDDFINHSELVQFYSTNVFTQTFKFKRFTGILKKKFNQQQEMHQNTVKASKKQLKGSSMPRKDITNFSTFKEQQPRSLEKGYIQASSPKVGLKRRPSSGIPMKKGDMLIKRRKNSFNECSKSCSIDVKHIDALKCSQSQKRSHSPPRPKPTISNCVCLKTISPSDLQVRGQHYQSIDPWQDETQKVRMLADLDITVKI